MAGNRKAAQDHILANIEALLPGSKNTEMYKQLFDSMDDKEFDSFMLRLDKGEINLAVVAPNLQEPKLSIERNLALAEKLGHKFFERIWIDGGKDVPAYLSPIPYLIVQLPLRRQAQILVKKKSIPEHNNSIDNLTGQPTGESKGSKISYPETQVMAALDLPKSSLELLKFRGGDVKGFAAMNAMISRTGGASLDSLMKLGTQVKSTTTMHTLLMCMHLQNTLL